MWVPHIPHICHKSYKYIYHKSPQIYLSQIPQIYLSQIPQIYLSLLHILEKKCHTEKLHVSATPHTHHIYKVQKFSSKWKKEFEIGTKVVLTSKWKIFQDWQIYYDTEYFPKVERDLRSGQKWWNSKKLSKVTFSNLKCCLLLRWMYPSVTRLNPTKYWNVNVNPPLSRMSMKQKNQRKQSLKKRKLRKKIDFINQKSQR